MDDTVLKGQEIGPGVALLGISAIGPYEIRFVDQDEFRRVSKNCHDCRVRPSCRLDKLLGKLR